MGDYKKYFNPLIKDVEGYREDVYKDINDIPTIGTGMNLKDPEVRGLMELRDINPDEVISGTRKLTGDELDDIHNKYVDKRERLVRSQVGPDLYETLSPTEKAAAMSLGYQSLNNLGSKLVGRIAEGDKIGALREIILNTNEQKSPGILTRRLKEAELYGGPLDFSLAFKAMSEAEKAELLNQLNQIDNPHTRQEMINKYSAYIGENKPAPFNQIKKLLKP